MGYKEKSIREVVKNIAEGKIYLPAIQRKFVWKPDQIIDLFDSIMKGYPIGTFLFWNLRDESIKQYTFYSFILHYHTKNNYLNQTTEKPELKNEIIGVLDGQQRLSSLFVSLQGTYAFKKPYARIEDESAYPPRYLCINLLKTPNGEEEENNYEFKFLTKEEITENDEEHYWFSVRNVLDWENNSNCIKYARENGFGDNDTFVNNLTDWWFKITKEKLISYFEIDKTDIEEILPIFVRVNSGGTQLSKTDLLFSTIVANWQSGRQKIESLIESINKKGFDFGNDFIMRTCLTLTESPVIFKVKTFKRENIDKIRDNWENIQRAIIQSVNLLVEFGFNRWNLTSRMAVCVVAYFIYNDGQLDAKNKKTIRKYLILAMLNQIYGGQPDRVITKIREALKNNQIKFQLEIINNSLDQPPMFGPLLKLGLFDLICI